MHSSLVSLSEDSLRLFLSQVYAAPILTKDQEVFYTQQFQKHKDADALKHLVLSHMRFVVHIAKKYQNFGVQLTDLIQEGTVGLIQSVHKFDESFNARLASFSVYWIKSAIHEFILKNWRLVKIATTKSQRKLFFNLHRFLKEVGSLNSDEVKFVANNLDVPEKEVINMEQRLRSSEDSLSITSEDDGFCGLEIQAPASDNPEYKVELFDYLTKQKSLLQNALTKLNDRQRQIIILRFLQDKKVKRTEVAKILNVSAERVRQIEQQALNLLKSNLLLESK